LSPLTSPRTRRLAGLSGLLATIGVLVLGRAAVGQSAQHHVSLATRASGPSSSAPSLPTGSRTVNGNVVDTPYGPVQVAVVFDSGRITDVQALQTPSDAGRSIRLADLATPILRQEVLTAQSAQIDTVSGATYTSDGYAQSVQYALDHASG
jgi:uncharacterized protein with FMN-binding domain